MQLKSSLRTTLLACLVLLGLQFLFPIALRAAAQPILFEECAEPFAGPEEDHSGLDGENVVAFLSHQSCRFGGPFVWNSGASLPRGSADRPGLYLLQVSGFQPSAP